MIINNVTFMSSDVSLKNFQSVWMLDTALCSVLLTKYSGDPIKNNAVGAI